MFWLRRHGHEVIAADSGTAALDMIRQNPADLIVTDVNLPGLTGLELLRCVRAESLNRRRAIVLTSRCDRLELARLTASLDAVVYSKPFSPKLLTQAVEQALAAHCDVATLTGSTSTPQQWGAHD